VQTQRREVKTSHGKQRVPEFVPKLLERLAVIAGLGCILSLVYLLFVIMSGGLAAPLIAGTALDQLTRNVTLAAQVFLWCLWIVVVVVNLRRPRQDAMGLVTMLVGLVLWMLLPLLIRARTGYTSAQALVQLAQGLITSFQTSGGAMIVLGFLRFAVGRVILLASPARTAARFTSGGGELAAAERALERPSLMRKCFELHFCQSSLRTNCPRFQEGVSCWKKKSGCYCDQGLATRLLTGMGANSRATMAEELHAAQRRTVGQGAKKAKKRAPCGECPIYLEHQKHKYRVISWLAYPAAALLIGGTIAIIRNGYQWIDYKMSTWLNQFQLLPHELTDKPIEMAPWISAENVAIGVIAVLVVGLVLQLTELAIFRLKL
jgi:hypothetical protein